MLDGVLVSVRNMASTTTERALPRDRLGRIGTPEGRAADDGGASTAVFGARCGAAALRGQRRNACIFLAPAIEGNAPVTVARRA